MPVIPTLDRPLRDERVAVCLAAERDIPEVLIAHQDDPELATQLGLARPPSGAELGRQMEEADGARETGKRVTLTIIEPGSDAFLGQIEVGEIDWAERRATVRAWVVPRVRAQGLERAALTLAARWLSDECGLQVRGA
jgi:RimJ/RimL family protein N-acetyltransferase